MAVERAALGDDGLSISRLVTGLWQIADMERDGGEVELDKAAAAMREYAEAGLDTFDMADHCPSPQSQLRLQPCRLCPCALAPCGAAAPPGPHAGLR